MSIARCLCAVASAGHGGPRRFCTAQWPPSSLLPRPLLSGKPPAQPPGGGGGRQQPAHPQYANYWAPLARKRHTMPHSAQPQHTNHWAPRTQKRHQQEHRPQRPTERSDPTQHAKGRTGDCPGPRKGTTTRRNVTQGGGQAKKNCVYHKLAFKPNTHSHRHPSCGSPSSWPPSPRNTVAQPTLSVIGPRGYAHAVACADRQQEGRGLPFGCTTQGCRWSLTRRAPITLQLMTPPPLFRTSCSPPTDIRGIQRPGLYNCRNTLALAPGEDNKGFVRAAAAAGGGSFEPLKGGGGLGTGLS